MENVQGKYDFTIQNAILAIRNAIFARKNAFLLEIKQDQKVLERITNLQ